MSQVNHKESIKVFLLKILQKLFTITCYFVLTSLLITQVNQNYDKKPQNAKNLSKPKSIVLPIKVLYVMSHYVLIAGLIKILLLNLQRVSEANELEILANYTIFLDFREFSFQTDEIHM